MKSWMPSIIEKMTRRCLRNCQLQFLKELLKKGVLGQKFHTSDLNCSTLRTFHLWNSWIEKGFNCSTLLLQPPTVPHFYYIIPKMITKRSLNAKGGLLTSRVASLRPPSFSLLRTEKLPPAKPSTIIPLLGECACARGLRPLYSFNTPQFKSEAERRSDEGTKP